MLLMKIIRCRRRGRTSQRAFCVYLRAYHHNIYIYIYAQVEKRVGGRASQCTKTTPGESQGYDIRG